MPTVPPTYISCGSGSDSILPTVGFIPEGQYSPTSPTPDPDLDDCVQVPGDTLGAVTEASSTAMSLQDKHRAGGGLTPHICLANLSLHSPPSFLGTPFDVSPRFEYPFPPVPSEPDSAMALPFSSPFTPISPSSYVHHAFTSFPPISYTSPPQAYHKPRSERAASPTHFKLFAKDPPVPPNLAAKKRSNSNSNALALSSPTPTLPQRKRSRSPTPERGQDREDAKVKRANAKTQGRRVSCGERPSASER